MKRYLLFVLCFLFATGQFVEAKKFKYPNGDYYEGKWKKGMPNGQGTMVYANGHKYIGEWVDGHYCGIGELILQNITYKGVFSNDSLNGEGEILFNNKVIRKGLFVNNKLKEGIVDIKTNNYVCNCNVKDFNPFSGTIIKNENEIAWHISYDNGNRTGHFKSQMSSNNFNGTEENGKITNIEYISSDFLTYALTKKDNGWTYCIKYLGKEFCKDNNSLAWDIKVNEINEKKIKSIIFEAIHPDTLADIGDVFYDAKKYETAVSYYNYLTEKEHLYGTYSLGWCLLYGNGIEKDIDKGVFYIKKAACSELSVAQYELGKFYEEGKFVEKNLSTSLDWYNKAAVNGDEDAQKRLTEIQNIQKILSSLDNSTYYCNSTSSNGGEINKLGIATGEIVYKCTLTFYPNQKASFNSHFSPIPDIYKNQTIHYKGNGTRVRHKEYVEDLCNRLNNSMSEIQDEYTIKEGTIIELKGLQFTILPERNSIMFNFLEDVELKKQ